MSKQREYARKAYAKKTATPEGKAEMALKRRLYRYNITKEEYFQMLSESEDRCMICGEKETSADGKGDIKALSVDHDHETGKVRGLLCNACNRGLGFLGDSSKKLRAAAEYLERHGK